MSAISSISRIGSCGITYHSLVRDSIVRLSRHGKMDCLWGSKMTHGEQATLSNQRQSLLGAYKQLGRSIVVVIDRSYYCRGAKVRKWKLRAGTPGRVKKVPLRGASRLCEGKNVKRNISTTTKLTL